MKKDQLTKRAVLEFIHQIGRVKQRTISDYFNYSIRTVRKRLRDLEKMGYISFYRLDGELTKIYFVTRDGKDILRNSNWGIQTKEDIHALARNDWVSVKVAAGYRTIIKRYDDTERVDLAGYTVDKKVVFLIDSGDIDATVDAIVENIKNHKEVELLVYKSEKQLKRIVKIIAAMTKPKVNQEYNRYNSKMGEQSIEIDEELRNKFKSGEGFLYYGRTVKEIEEDRAKYSTKIS